MRARRRWPLESASARRARRRGNLRRRYQRLKPFDLRDIKADPFIEEFLEDIESRHFSEITVIIIITLYSASMCTFLLAWILSQIFTKRYLDLLNKTKNCNTQTEMFLKN